MSNNLNIAITISPVGWKHLEERFDNLDEEARDAIRVGFKPCDEHLVNDDGYHLIKYYYTRSCWDGLKYLKKILREIPDEYYYFSIAEDGGEEIEGNSKVNHFYVSADHRVVTDETVLCVQYSGNMHGEIQNEDN